MHVLCEVNLLVDWSVSTSYMCVQFSMYFGCLSISPSACLSIYLQVCYYSSFCLLATRSDD